MNFDRCTKSVLVVIAFFLGMVALHPYIAPPAIQASSGDGYPVYVEPGVSMLLAPDGSQQVLGKVVVDLRNGNVWGFPTLTQNPYPTAGANTKPQVSHPFLLGKFALSDIDR
jgi:hypothetical protein